MSIVTLFTIVKRWKWPLLARVLQRNKTNKVYVCIYVKKCITKLDSHDCGDWQIQICSVCWLMMQFLSKAGRQRPRRANGAHDVWRQCPRESPLVRGGLSSCSNQAFSWLDEAHPHYGSKAPYSEFTSLNVNVIQKLPLRWYTKLTITQPVYPSTDE